MVRLHRGQATPTRQGSGGSIPSLSLANGGGKAPAESATQRRSQSRSRGRALPWKPWHKPTWRMPGVGFRPTPYRVAEWMVRSFATLYGKLPAEAVRGSTTSKRGSASIHAGAEAQRTLPRHASGRCTDGPWSKEGAPASNPILGIRKPPIKSRGSEAVVSEADHARLMETPSLSPPLRDVLFALRESGARPGEVTSVTAADFLPEQGVWILAKHKTAHKTGKPRIVYLYANARPPPLELAKNGPPEGPLFRNAHGQPWHKIGLGKRVRELRLKLGIKGRLFPYCYRHEWATTALANGVPDAHVAELLGPIRERQCFIGTTRT